ncbi:MAG: mechanosensitive ion channel family protein [Flavobacteriales bacterium]|nr:mechanosensitive ion channel family protein [Flavobacteriales bacterium]
MVTEIRGLLRSLPEWMRGEVMLKLLELGIGILGIWLLVNASKALVNRRASNADVRYRWRKLADLLGTVVFVILLITIYSHQLGGLSVTFGLAAAGIAFALQEVVASVAGWMAVMFGGFYRTGDRVQLGGTKGDVIDIGVLRTTIMEVGQWVDSDLYTGRIVLVANSFVFKEPVFNYSSDFPFLWDEIKVPITFESDHDKARALFLSALEQVAGSLSESSQERWRAMVNKYLIEDARTDPWVAMTFNDNWVEYTLRYVVDYKGRRSTKDALFSRILRDVQASQGEVRFASSTLRILNDRPVNSGSDTRS